jgi:mycofactocin system glycosyltransferase
LRLALDQAVRRYRHGQVLVGGAGGRIITLSPAGCRALDDELLRAGPPASAAARTLGRRLLDAGLAHPRPAAGGAGEHVTVTIAIPVCDRAAALERALAAVGSAHPVVVVDDGSSDAAAIAEVCGQHRARLLVHAANAGPAAARNTALAAISTDLVAFLDSDCRPPVDWIEALTPHFQDPAVVAVAPRVRPRPAAGRRSVRGRYAAARSPLDLGPREGLVGPGRPIAYVPTAALIVRRSALTGGFDPALRYGEDVDAIWRLHDAGGRIRYEPRVVVEHEEPAGWPALLGRRLRYGTSAAPLAARHPGRLAPLVLRGGPAATVLAALCGHRRLASGLAAASAVRLARRCRTSRVPSWWALPWTLRATWLTAVTSGRAATMFAGPALLLALRHRRLRRPALTLLLLPPLADWCSRRPSLDPLRWVLAAAADDVAYGAGVWIGCARHRTIRPLTPRGRSAV